MHPHQRLGTKHFTVGSVTLWWIAKKRQWDVRRSISRVSRRITGRSTVENKNRQDRRTGIRLNSPPPGKNSNPTQTRDLEKGFPLSNKVAKMTTTITSVGK